MLIIDKAIVKSTFSSPFFLLGIIVLLTTLLSGCITQKYENDTPVVQNQANRDEMAATRISLGLGYLKMGNMSQAKLNLEKAKKFSPQLVQVHTAFAHYYEVVGEIELTTQSYEKALLIKADDADTLNNYGVFLCRQNEVHAAEIQFLRAIAVPSYLLVAQSYENLASCYLQIDDFSKAEQYLNKAIAHSPNRTATLLQMVRLQYAMADYGEAKRYQQKFERNTRRFTPDSLALAYKVYRKLGQRRTASNYGNMLVKMYPQSWESKQYLLNELEVIEVDNLAKRYQVTQRKLKSESYLDNDKSKKRIVKLSPKNKAKTTTSLAIVKESNSPVEANLSVTDTPSSITNTATKEKLAKSQVKPETVVTDNDMLPTSAAVTATVLGAAIVSAADDKTNASVENIDNVSVDKVESVSDDSVENLPTSITDTPVVNTALTEVAVNNNDELLKEKNFTTNNVAENVVVPDALLSVTNEQLKIVDEKSTERSADNLQDAVLNESNSTLPIPAKREEPLPEPIQYVATDTVESLSVDAQLPEVESAESDADLITLSANTDSNNEKKDDLAVNQNELPQEPQIIYHQVSGGETLYAISVKYNVKIKALRQWNKISDKHKLQIKEKLYVVNPETVININD